MSDIEGEQELAGESSAKHEVILSSRAGIRAVKPYGRWTNYLLI